MTKIKMTYHVQEDRIERMTAIATTVGFGKPIIQKIHNGARKQLTTTGIILVKAPDEEVLITLYAGSYQQIARMMNGRVTKEMKKIIQRNQELGLIGR